MFGTSSHQEQSKALDIQFQQQIDYLKQADASTELREFGKLTSICGLIGFVSSSFFQFSPIPPLTLTTCAAAAWIGGYFTSKHLEPKTQENLNFLKELKREQGLYPLVFEAIGLPSNIDELRVIQDYIRIASNEMLIERENKWRNFTNLSNKEIPG